MRPKPWKGAQIVRPNEKPTWSHRGLSLSLSFFNNEVPVKQYTLVNQVNHGYNNKVPKKPYVCCHRKEDPSLRKVRPAAIVCYYFDFPLDNHVGNQSPNNNPSFQHLVLHKVQRIPTWRKLPPPPSLCKIHKQTSIWNARSFQQHRVPLVSHLSSTHSLTHSLKLGAIIGFCPH